MMGKMSKSWNNFPFNKALLSIIVLFYIFKYLFSVNLPSKVLGELLRQSFTEIQRLEAEREGEGGGDWAADKTDQMSYFDIYRERPIRLTVRALVPTKEHPKVTTRS